MPLLFNPMAITGKKIDGIRPRDCSKYLYIIQKNGKENSRIIEKKKKKMDIQVRLSENDIQPWVVLASSGKDETRTCKRTSSGSNFKTPNCDDTRRVAATEGLEGALPATAGATARPPGVLCCSLVGNGFGVPLGERDILLPSAKS